MTKRRDQALDEPVVVEVRPEALRMNVDPIMAVVTVRHQR